MMDKQHFFPAEWHAQSFVQLTWPHANSDWDYILDEVQECFINIAREIASRQCLLIVTPEPDVVRCQIDGCVNMANVRIACVDSNDTWARDHGGVTVIENGKPMILDFQFNGWGLKFAADKDNLITERLVRDGHISARLRSERQFVFEGGSIESDGEGTLLTTAECLLSPNRNATMSRNDVEDYLKRVLFTDRVLWLENGFLEGDDTDSHIDTLARLCPNNTIAYVQSNDANDVHHVALRAMEEELKAFRTARGGAYHLVPLPMTSPIVIDGERLPATYANFLVINGAVLVPIYNDRNDSLALEQMAMAFPEHEIVGIDCLTLIRQHGSLHCVTMQFPKGVALSL